MKIMTRDELEGAKLMARHGAVDPVRVIEMIADTAITKWDEAERMRECCIAGRQRIENFLRGSIPGSAYWIMFDAIRSDFAAALSSTPPSDANSRDGQHHDLIDDEPEPPESPANWDGIASGPAGEQIVRDAVNKSRAEHGFGPLPGVSEPGTATQVGIMEEACAEAGRQITIDDFSRRGPETWSDDEAHWLLAAARRGIELAAENAELREQAIKMWDRIGILEGAIRQHRSQKADDRCISDDDRLYEALGDGIKCDQRVGSKDEMLANCKRFIDRRCEAGGWPTYRELEERLAKAEKFKAYVHKRLDEAGVPADPDPDANAKSGCRIGGRLNWLLIEKVKAEAIVAKLPVTADGVPIVPGMNLFVNYSWCYEPMMVSVGGGGRWIPSECGQFDVTVTYSTKEAALAAKGES